MTSRRDGLERHVRDLGSVQPLCSLCFFVLFFKIYFLFIYLFLAALGLHCGAQAFSSYGKRELLFIAVRVLLVAEASLVAEHGL